MKVRYWKIRNMKVPVDVIYSIIKGYFVGKLEVLPGNPTSLSRDIVMYCGTCFWKGAKNAPHLTIDALWVYRLFQRIQIYDSHTPRWRCNPLVRSRPGWLHGTQSIMESKGEFSCPKYCPASEDPKGSMFFPQVSANGPNADLTYVHFRIVFL